MSRRMREKIVEFVEDNRLLVLTAFAGVLFVILISRLFVLQIIQGKEHMQNFAYKIQKTITKNGIRGNIYDVNGKLIAYNKLAYTVTFTNDSAFSTLARQNETTENEEKNKVLYKVIKIIEANGDHITTDFPVKRIGKGKFKFTISGSELQTFLRNSYGIGNDVTGLTKEQKILRQQQLESTAKDVFEFFKNGTGGSPGSGKMFDISDEYSEKDALKIMAIRYQIYLSRFSQYKKVTIASEISDKSIAAIEERGDELIGISISKETLRSYNFGESMGQVVGYTGAVSDDELDEYNQGKNEKDKDYYTSNDVVGKAGIEKIYETNLHGNSGSETVLVDKIGKILEHTDEVAVGTGNDVHLSIDAELQQYCYELLESKLAGIILSKMTTADSSGNRSDNIRIPIKNLYYSLIKNKVIDIADLDSDEATSYEKSIYKQITRYKKGKLSSIKRDLLNSTVPHNDLSKQKKAYDNYIYSMLGSNKVLLSSSIDTKDDIYKKWKSGKISLGEFLRYAINKEWIETSGFDIASSYYNTDQIFEALANYIVGELKKDSDFDSLVCEYMIKSGNLSGKSVCLLLYEQGVLSKKKDADYNSLKSGSLSAYSFIRKKISNREITAAQLGLDPCSGAVIITDVKTGKIKAFVSYPSYDSNKLANVIDGDYYSKLVSNESKPLYNRALNHKTAPGSTFKPLSAIAGLNEGVISSGTIIKCTGIFNKITPPAKCWVYPNSHKNETVSKAITNSCNVFFYEVGHRLGTTSSGSVSDTQGLKVLEKYATMLGLNKLSGVELPESEPHVSDESLVRSYIGQGTNSYAPVQIANYATTIANSGTVFDLSLMDSIVSPKGKVVEKFPVKKVSKVKLNSESYWNYVHSGMYGVAYDEHKDIFKDLTNVKIAGKTGTAQEDKKRPNHALFISYGPYTSPEIAVTVVMPFAYTSSNAANVAKDVYQYYFGTKKEKAKLFKQVEQAGHAVSGSSD